MGDEPFALYALQLAAAVVEVTAAGLVLVLVVEGARAARDRVVAFLHRGEDVTEW